MDDTILVKSGRADNRVVIWERDRAHPSGEIFVAGAHEDYGDGTYGEDDLSPPIEVAMTATVMRKLGEKELLRVERENPTDADKRAAELERNIGATAVTTEQQAAIDQQVAQAREEGRRAALADQGAPAGPTAEEIQQMVDAARAEGEAAGRAAAAESKPDDHESGRSTRSPRS